MAAGSAERTFYFPRISNRNIFNPNYCQYHTSRHYKHLTVDRRGFVKIFSYHIVMLYIQYSTQYTSYIFIWYLEGRTEDHTITYLPQRPRVSTPGFNSLSNRVKGGLLFSEICTVGNTWVSFYWLRIRKLFGQLTSSYQAADQLWRESNQESPSLLEVWMMTGNQPLTRW